MSQTKKSFKDIDRKIVALLSFEALNDKDMHEAARTLYGDYWFYLDKYLERDFNIKRDVLRGIILTKTLERVTARIKAYDPDRAGLLTWMCGFAKNVAREMLSKELKTVNIDDFLAEEKAKDRRGKRKTRSEIPFEDGVKLQTAEDQDAVSLFAYLLRTEHRDCLERLDQKYRVLIEMILDGKSKEIYKNEFKISDDAYRTRLSRAIKHLRFCIAEKQRLGSAPANEKE